MPFLYLFLFFLFPVSLYSQQTGWQELTISDGLSQGMIFGMAQDPKGFIWVATKDGLNRYDGHNFTTFTHDPYNEYSISGNTCTALLLDSRGWLWVGTLNEGINLFNIKTQRFYHINLQDKTAPNAGNYGVNAIYEDPSGAIWVTANFNKLLKISIPSSLLPNSTAKANLTSQVTISQQLFTLPEGHTINHLSFQPNGQALAVCESGSYFFNWQSPQKSDRYVPFTGELAGLVGIYGNITQNCLITSYANKLIIQLNNQQKTILLNGKPETALAIKAFDSKTLAIATDKYLWLMSPEELIRQDSLMARNAFVALPPNLYAIANLLRDKTGNIWVGTSGYGLRKFNPKVKQFRSVLPNTTLSYLYVDKQGRTYARHEFSYEQLDPATNRLKPFLDNKIALADRRARYMMQDRTGTFWISNTNFQTQQMSLIKFSADWKLLKKYLLPPGISFGFYSNQTIEDKSGKLWIGAINGTLLQFDPKSETFHTFSYQSLLPQKGAEIETTALYFDQQETLWIGTTKGLIRADHVRTKPRFSIYKNSNSDRQSLSNDLISCLINDPYQPNRYLWVGTKGGGLNRLDKETGQFSHITEAQGLPNNVVYGILTDEFQHFWMSTNRGLAQLNPQTQLFRNFTKADGLQDDEFNTGSFFKAPSGELLFGGVHGLTTFKPSNITPSNQEAPPAQLIGLKVNNEAVPVNGPDAILSEGIEYTQRIDLAHTQNLLTLEFGVMDFANSIKNRYRYRLEGIDEDWIEAGTNRFANYSQLPNGHFILQMMGSTDGQVWSKPIELDVHVHPPFYRTWWAYLLYVVLLALIGWQLYQFQMQRLLLEQRIAFEQKEASRLIELDVLRTTFFTNISHEFRTPLTLILSPLSELKERFPHEPILSTMERNGKRLLSLINQLLDLSKIEAGQLKPETESGDIAGFLQALAGSFSSLAQNRQLRFTFEQNRTNYWVFFDRDKLEKIVTNLLSNAFKFTPANHEVQMKVRYNEQNGMEVTVQDSGIGIPAHDLEHIFERFYQRSAGTADNKHQRPYEGTGIGLTLVHELVQVLGGTINVTSLEQVGTTFVVTLPLRLSEHVKPDQTNVATFLNQAPADLYTYEDTSLINPADAISEATDKVLLIVDDNADIRAYIRSIFESEYHILEAQDGQQGLELATATLPTLVICDLMMPRLDGFGFCQALKTQETTSHIPIIMLTAKATAEDRIEGFGLGADDYLAKPFNRLELQARVRNLILQRQRLYERFRASLPISQPEELVSAIPVSEHQFIDQLTAIVHQHIDDTGFTVEQLAEGTNMSRVQLHRKLKAVANTTATQFIRDIRLARAAQLLTENRENVTQIAYAVGFDNLSYFAKVFQEQYGVTPSQYGKPQPSVS